MDRHLVAVEVGIESRTDKRMKLDRLSFYKDRLKSLDAESVQCRSTVQHDRVLRDDVLEDIPYFALKALDHLLGALNIVRRSAAYEFLHNERLEELDRHLLGKTALIDLQLRTYDDNGTSRIVDALSEKILTETSGLAFQHVGERLQRTVARSGDRSSAAAVVDQGVDSFLKHALFISHDDLRSAELQEPPQAVVAVDDSSVKVVQVRGRKTAAVQLDHRAKVGRNDRDRVHDHPLRTVA